MPAKRFTVELERVERTATQFRNPLDSTEVPDRVQVTVELDTAPRTVRVPRDLREALRRDSEADAAFGKLSFTHRREYVEWVEEAKRPETRERRIAGTLERLRERRPAP
jgi:uncharacterized protein YdeI (YjbR/CyaY-like superfamily)